jgi:Phage integrase, N-terminal SAM-like domain
MTPLRKRMIEDMRVAGFAAGTQTNYLHAVRALAAYYVRSPDELIEEQVRNYLLHLRDERGVALGTFKTNHSGIQFLYCRTLERPWPLFSKKESDHRKSVVCPTFSRMLKSARFWRTSRTRPTKPVSPSSMPAACASARP